VLFLNAVRAVLRLEPLPWTPAAPEPPRKKTPPEAKLKPPRHFCRCVPLRRIRTERAGDWSPELCPGSPRRRRARESFPLGETVREADEEGGSLP